MGGTGQDSRAEGMMGGRAGADVMIVEQDVGQGGSLLDDPADSEGKAPNDWRTETITELRGCDNVRIMVDATVAGYYDYNVLTIHDRSSAYRQENPVETFWKVRAGRVVLATGAIEQPLMFGNNDLPGIMLAGAMHQYASRYGVQCGKCIVGVVNNDLAWHSIVALRDAGIEIPMIIDSRDTVDERLVNLADDRDIAVHIGATPIIARGSGGVKELAYRDGSGSSNVVDCDAIAMSGGMNPTVHLYSQAGGKLRYDDELACFLPHECRQQVAVIGAANGEFATPHTYNIGARKRSAAKTNSQWIDFLDRKSTRLNSSH